MQVVPDSINVKLFVRSAFLFYFTNSDSKLYFFNIVDFFKTLAQWHHAINAQAIHLGLVIITNGICQGVFMLLGLVISHLMIRVEIGFRVLGF